MVEDFSPTVGPVAPNSDDAGATRAARPPVEMPAAKYDAELSRAKAKPEVKVKSKPEANAKEQPAETLSAVPPQEAYHNVRLHFRVDPTTHEVTVLMVDKVSHRVIRSIPSEEIGKLKEGDLVELFA
jgi:uncharacterized FlaG/YvyC family protein